jgi:hypothetical protein
VPASRPWPHVAVERLKGFTPTTAHFNTPAAVIGISWISGGSAPSNHTGPGVVFWRAASPVGSSRPAAAIEAGTGSSVNKIGSSQNSFPTTVAAAKPLRAQTRRSADKTQDAKATKSFIGQIMFDCLRNWYDSIIHLCTSVADLERGRIGVRCAYPSPLLYHMRVIVP